MNLNFGYVTSINYINLIIFIETFVMANIFGIRLARRDHYPIRVVITFLVGGASVFFFPLIRIRNAWGSYFYMVFMYLSILAIAILMISFCFKGRFKNFVFLGVSGYAVHHFVSTFQDLFFSITSLDKVWSFFQWQHLLINFSFTILICSIISYFYLKNSYVQTLMNRKRVSIVAVIIISLNIMISSFARIAPRFGISDVSSLISQIYNLVTSLLCLAILFGLMDKEYLEKEIAIMDNMFKEEKKQYEISKAAMDSISIRAHDLKHHINDMMAGKEYWTAEEKKKISEEISAFNSIYKTGNEAVDLVLTNRAMVCEKYGIEMTCMVDGKLFDFMENYDIYSLFENALDNAIDAAKKVVDQNSRFIFVNIKQNKNMISFHVENSFVDEITLKDGLPMTSNQDKDSHGFGIKSMQRISEKYNGFVNFSHKDQVFYLDVCFPMKA